MGYLNPRSGSCPRRLVGKRCRWNSPNGPCWCQTSINDHGGTYTRHGERVVLWEPYAISPRALTAVVEAAEMDGLNVTVHGGSGHALGMTVAIEFNKKVARQSPTLGEQEV